MSNLDYDWLMNRLRQQGVDLKCELCGNEGDRVWAPLGNGADLVARLPTFSLAGEHYGNTTDVYGLACTRCGNLRLHALFPLLGRGDAVDG